MFDHPMPTDTFKKLTLQHSLVVREVTLEDAQRLQDYYRRVASEKPNNTSIRTGLVPSTVEAMRDVIEAYQRRPTWKIFIVDNGAEIVGQIRVTGGTLWSNPHSAEISINVRADQRGKGIGTTLLDHAITWAKSMPQLRHLWLYALTRNLGAIRLYERVGFVLEGMLREGFYLPDEGSYQDTVIMTYSLR